MFMSFHLKYSRQDKDFKITPACKAIDSRCTYYKVEGFNFK